MSAHALEEPSAFQEALEAFANVQEEFNIAKRNNVFGPGSQHVRELEKAAAAVCDAWVDEAGGIEHAPKRAGDQHIRYLVRMYWELPRGDAAGVAAAVLAAQKMLKWLEKGA